MGDVVITGSTGFVGTNLFRYLRDIGISARPLNLRNPSTEWDLASTQAVVHLAGKAHDLKNVSKPEEYYQVNTVLSKQVFDAFLASDAKVFIMLSSVKAVRDSLHKDILTEELLPEPGTVYGKTKLQAEEYILNQPIPEGKNVFILRPCMIHGPGNKGNLNLLYRFVTMGIPYPLASFENHRSFLSVGNLCFVIKELIERSDIPSGVYHVADDQSLSTNRVVQLMGEVLKKDARLWRLPEAWIRFLARIGDRLGLPLNSERLGKLTENYMVSNAKLKKVLQKELPLTTEDGLRITLQSFAVNQPSLG